MIAYQTKFQVNRLIFLEKKNKVIMFSNCKVYNNFSKMYITFFTFFRILNIKGNNSQIKSAVQMTAEKLQEVNVFKVFTVCL